MMSDTESAANMTLEAGTSNAQVCKTGSNYRGTKLMLTTVHHVTTL